MHFEMRPFCRTHLLARGPRPPQDALYMARNNTSHVGVGSPKGVPSMSLSLSLSLPLSFSLCLSLTHTHQKKGGWGANEPEQICSRAVALGSRRTEVEPGGPPGQRDPLGRCVGSQSFPCTCKSICMRSSAPPSPPRWVRQADVAMTWRAPGGQEECRVQSGRVNGAGVCRGAPGR